MCAVYKPWKWCVLALGWKNVGSKGANLLLFLWCSAVSLAVIVDAELRCTEELAVHAVSGRHAFPHAFRGKRVVQVATRLVDVRTARRLWNLPLFVQRVRRRVRVAVH